MWAAREGVAILPCLDALCLRKTWYTIESDCVSNTKLERQPEHLCATPASKFVSNPLWPRGYTDVTTMTVTHGETQSFILLSLFSFRPQTQYSVPLYGGNDSAVLSWLDERKIVCSSAPTCIQLVRLANVAAGKKWPAFSMLARVLAKPNGEGQNNNITTCIITIYQPLI